MYESEICQKLQSFKQHQPKIGSIGFFPGNPKDLKMYPKMRYTFVYRNEGNKELIEIDFPVDCNRDSDTAELNSKMVDFNQINKQMGYTVLDVSEKWTF